jgi:hypothetical protein
VPMLVQTVDESCTQAIMPNLSKAYKRIVLFRPVSIMLPRLSGLPPNWYQRYQVTTCKPLSRNILEPPIAPDIIRFSS